MSAIVKIAENIAAWAKLEGMAESRLIREQVQYKYASSPADKGYHLAAIYSAASEKTECRLIKERSLKALEKLV